MEQSCSVVVIGAGISGLRAAQLLKTQFPDVLIVEAQDRVGGRIKQLHGFAPWPIQLGAEFVHGTNSAFTRVTRDLNIQYRERLWPDWWYTDGKLIPDKQADPEIKKVHQLFEGIGFDHTVMHPPPGRDVNAVDWITSNGGSPKMLAVAEACYANDFACSLRQLGVREMIEENRKWNSGDTYLLTDRCISAVTDHLARDLRFRLNWPVTKIAYDKDGALLSGPGGATLRARKVVITIPIRVLQDGAVAFAPALPAPKLAAMHRIKMGNVVKVIIAFGARFWPDDMYDVVCTEGMIPELWMTSYPTSDPACSHLRAITGFVAGEKADVVGALPPAVAVERFLAQLDEMFGTPSNPKPATAAMVKSHVVNWGKEPYIRGGYTYPTFEAELGDRDVLAAPVANTLFWAGEATHPGINPCMQGALETAERAAAQVIASSAVSKM